MKHHNMKWGLSTTSQKKKNMCFCVREQLGNATVREVSRSFIKVLTKFLGFSEFVYFKKFHKISSKF